MSDEFRPPVVQRLAAWPPLDLAHKLLIPLLTLAVAGIVSFGWGWADRMGERSAAAASERAVISEKLCSIKEAVSGLQSRVDLMQTGGFDAGDFAEYRSIFQRDLDRIEGRITALEARFNAIGKIK